MGVQAPEEPVRINDIEYTLRDQQLMSAATGYFRWQSRLIQKEIGQRIVEVGCGIGNFTGTLTNREAVLCADAEEACVERHRLRFSGFPNIQSRVLDVVDPAFTQLRGFRPDSIVCVNVLEHIRNDHEAMGNMRAILERGGIVAVLVPAFPALYGPIDRHLNHYRRYTRERVRELASSADLRIKKMIYLNLVGFVAWWVNAKILSREEHSKAQIRIFDRCVVPVQSRLESIVSPPFGQSLLAVFEKP
ncbi:MAG: class I SAM-dependent methyltransferase [Bryobacteraceae bacterium]